LDNAQLYLVSGNFTVNSGGTVSLTGDASSTKPTSIVAAGGNLKLLSGSTINFAGGGTYYALSASLGTTLAGNATFGNANYGFFGGNLALDGCTVFAPAIAAKTTLSVASGGLSTGSGSALYFNPPSGTYCGTAITNATPSTYALNATSYIIRSAPAARAPPYSGRPPTDSMAARSRSTALRRSRRERQISASPAI